VTYTNVPVPEVSNRFSSPLLKVDDRARMHLYLELSEVNDSSLIAIAKVADIEVEIVNPELKIVQAWVPYDRIEALAELEVVTRIRPPEYSTFGTGSITSQGDSILKANLVRSTLNVTGAGVKVGVISDGANNPSSAQTSGDLPSSFTSFGTCNTAVTGTTCNEGTAMMEIVHDLAPGATLAMGAAATSLDFIQRVTDLTNWGAKVIVDDESSFGQPYFEDGSMASAYANALAQGIVMVSAAGNYAQQHYQGTFLDSGGAGWHNFGGGDETMAFTVSPGRTAAVFLQWSNQFGHSNDDYDLYIYDASATTILASSRGFQLGFQDPLEAVTIACTGTSTCTFNAAVKRPLSATVQTIELFFSGGFPTEHIIQSDSLFGHTAVPGVISAAAISASNPGNLTAETYSSRGPSTIFFPGFQQRATPILTTIDCVSDTGAGGFSTTFCGTSAAAPHAAAVAALLLQAKSSLTTAQVKSAMQNTAADRGASGYDNTYGSGLVDALAAVSSVMPTVSISKGGTGSGTVTSNPSAVNCGSTCQGSFIYNSQVALTASAASGSTFSSWTENGSVVSSSTTYTFTLTSSRALVANFAGANYTISVSASPSAGGTVSGGGTFAAGSSRTVTASANSGYAFTNWTENGGVVSSSASYTFTLNSNRTLVANFAAVNYTISVSASPSAGGTVTGGGTFAAGSSRTVTASANSGYTFSNWTENGGVVSSSTSYTFTLNSNRSLVANFTSPNYTISVSASPSAGGTVTGGGTFAAGSSRTVTASANSGYTFSNWTENGGVVSSSTSYTFTLNSNRSLVANFTSPNYTISVSASPSAGGTVSGGGTFAAGTSRTVTASANSGYTFVSWTENGGAVSSSASYTFTLNASRNLVAVFSAGNLPNLTPYQPPGWANKIVVSKVTGTHTDDTSFAPTDTLYIDWAVINSGLGATAAVFQTQMLVDGVVIGTFPVVPPMNPNAFQSSQDAPLGPLANGVHTITIQADTTGAIAESDESDNQFSRTIVVGNGGTHIRNDFDGDGKADVVWRHTVGTTAVWSMNGGAVLSGAYTPLLDGTWILAGTGDFNGDGKTDLLWRYPPSGLVAVWLMNGTSIISSAYVNPLDSSWKVAGVGDFDGDGKDDVLWRHSLGINAVWFMNGAAISSGAYMTSVTPDWAVAAVGDFNGDHKADILWRHTSGINAVWLMNGVTMTTGLYVNTLDSSWTLAATGDYDGDGKADVLWRSSFGTNAIWFMNGAAIRQGAYTTSVDSSWAAVASGDFNGDGKADLMWRSSDSRTAIWIMNGTGISGTYGPLLPTSWNSRPNPATNGQ